MGSITRIGKNSERAVLIQASRTLVRKDVVMQGKYDRLKFRSGGKRAIVAIARTLLIRMRRLLHDKNPYVVGLVAVNYELKISVSGSWSTAHHVGNCCRVTTAAGVQASFFEHPG